MPKIILLTGPAGAGKSTTCDTFAKTSEGTWAAIGQDDIRWYIKSGFANPTKTWTDETAKQWEVSQFIVGDMIRRYGNAGINCIVDCFAPKGTFDKWEKALKGINYKLVVLLPAVEAAIHRDTQRPLEEHMKEKRVREHHEWFSAWVIDKRATVIDTTNLTIQEVVKQIQSVVSVNRT